MNKWVWINVMRYLTPHEKFIASEVCCEAFKASFSGWSLEERRCWARVRKFFFLDGPQRTIWDVFDNLTYLRPLIFPYLEEEQSESSWVGSRENFHLKLHVHVSKIFNSYKLAAWYGYCKGRLLNETRITAYEIKEWCRYQIFDGAVPTHKETFCYFFGSGLLEWLKREKNIILF